MRSHGSVLWRGCLAAVAAAALACGGGGGGGGPTVVKYDLTVATAGTGTGTIVSDPAGIDCGATCTGSYASGTVVTLTATALEGGSFAGWSGVTGCAGTGTCAVTLAEATKVTATFISFHHRPAKTSLRVSYDPGTDGRYDTADDVAYGYNRVTYQASGDSAIDAWYFGPHPAGPDNVLFNADDIPGGYWKQQAGLYGWTVRAPGTDALWFTSDDPVYDWEKFDVRTTSDGSTINVVYDDNGVDGIWFNEDDGISQYYLRSRDANGAETRRLTYVGPGVDGKWFTSDDVISNAGYVVNTYSLGNTRAASWDRQVEYVNAGLDGKWAEGGDDLIGYCRVHVFGDDSEYWTKELTYTPGTDEKCFTADDVLTGAKKATNTY